MTNDELAKVVRQHSVIIKDPANRSVSVIEEKKGLLIANEQGVGLGEVYRAALENKIIPQRYLRNMDSIDIKGQLKLAGSCVAVVGAGGLGGNVLILLARIGLGRLKVIDGDSFDETNLNRQALSSCRALGEFKAEEAAKVIKDINPAVSVEYCCEKLNEGNAGGFLDKANVAVDALDNVAGRFILEKAAMDAGIPFVHGALAGFEGQIMTVFPGDSGLKMIYNREASLENMPNRPEAVHGVPAMTASIIANFQAMEVIKILLKKEEIFRSSMVHIDIERGEVNRFKVG